MRNWFNWEWDDSFPVLCIAIALIWTTLYSVASLGLTHYLGLDPGPFGSTIRFLLVWFGILGTYAAFLSVGVAVGAVGGLLLAIGLSKYALYIQQRMPRLALDSFTGHVFVLGLVGGLGLAGYLHLFVDETGPVALLGSYMFIPVLMAFSAFCLWASMLEIWRRIVSPQASYD